MYWKGGLEMEEVEKFNREEKSVHSNPYGWVCFEIWNSMWNYKITMATFGAISLDRKPMIVPYFTRAERPNDSLSRLESLKNVCSSQTSNLIQSNPTATPNKQQERSCWSMLFQGKVKMAPLDLWSCWFGSTRVKIDVWPKVGLQVLFTAD